MDEAPAWRPAARWYLFEPPDEGWRGVGGLVSPFLYRLCRSLVHMLTPYGRQLTDFLYKDDDSCFDIMITKITNKR